MNHAAPPPHIRALASRPYTLPSCAPRHFAHFDAFRHPNQCRSLVYGMRKMAVQDRSVFSLDRVRYEQSWTADQTHTKNRQTWLCSNMSTTP